MHAVIIIARLVHIIAGAYWFGTILFINLFLGPAVAQIGPAGAPFMRALMQRKYSDFTLTMATLAILAGLYLVYVDSAGFNSAWFRGSFGQTLSIGMAAAIVAWIIGVVVVRPLLSRMARLGQSAELAGESERQTLLQQLDETRNRLIKHSVIVMVLLLIATGAMAIARYV